MYLWLVKTLYSNSTADLYILVILHTVDIYNWYHSLSWH